MFIEHKKDSDLRNEIWTKLESLLTFKEVSTYQFKHTEYGDINLEKTSSETATIKFQAPVANIKRTAEKVEVKDEKGENSKEEIQVKYDVKEELKLQIFNITYLYSDTIIKYFDETENKEVEPKRAHVEIVFDIIAQELKREKLKAMGW